MKLKPLFCSIALSTMMFATVAPADACTGIRLVADNGAPVFGRTMEFGNDVIEFNWKTYPQGYQFKGHTSEGANGKEWAAKYGFVAAIPFEAEAVTEGVNEEGLQVGLFFFQPYSQAEYQQYDPSLAHESIGGWQFATYVLSQAANVEEAKALLKSVKVVDSNLYPSAEGWDFSPQAHMAINDAEGNAAVVQYVNGELHIFDNPLGTITNAPRFEWHQENLKRYTSLPIDKAAPLGDDVRDVEAGGLDIGNLENIPGEITSANRFVRASIYSQTADRFADADEGVHSVFNILNNFDMPKGVKQYRHSDGKDYSQFAQWTTVSDLQNKRLYIRSFYSPSVKMVDLNEIDFTDGKVHTFDIPTSFEYDKIELD
ncbi:choloylglycine hydrolase [Shewanella sp. UCD-FRSSP16_17]|uniref:linear amide C-N hydrolase n=1 Tax=unclassified Shewanella TaxID=196818 RepID=UPI0007EEDDFF|nr:MULTISPECIES: linear amide C-N hydrolase [unclassified Shewanella]MBQ4891398.1 linear amide C-N hydrolase [Shewanella sp. MMG014]OBT04753.1 choloylglycine hydrolase [Shewanella sp. UCD-FRSSP16_17]